MTFPHIPQDDLVDVLEMSAKIEDYINFIFEDNEVRLAMSALTTAVINCMFDLCSTLDEIIFYRNLFVQILDDSIKNINIEDHQ